MNSSDTIRLHALQLKKQLSGSGISGTFLDAVLAQNPDVAAKAMRNICALISPELFDKIEQFCKNLELSKREVVEMALIDFMEKANNIMDEVKPFENVSELASTIDDFTRANDQE